MQKRESEWDTKYDMIIRIQKKLYHRFDFCSVTKDTDLVGGVEVELDLVVSHCKVEQFR